MFKNIKKKIEKNTLMAIKYKWWDLNIYKLLRDTKYCANKVHIKPNGKKFIVWHRAYF